MVNYTRLEHSLTPANVAVEHKGMLKLVQEVNPYFGGEL